MKKWYRSACVMAVVALSVLPAACGDSGPTGAGDGALVFIDFAPAASLSLQGVPQAQVEGVESEPDYVLEHVYLVVDEFKLEGNEGACVPDPELNPDPKPDCGKFEAPPYFLSLDMTLEVEDRPFMGEADPGTYTHLKFETKAPGGDGDLVTQMEEHGITGWPSEASLLVTGQFTPEGETESREFRVFFDAEVKVVLPMDHELVIDPEDADPWVVKILVDPYAWFETENGLIDLPAMDYDATEQTVHYFEFKLENGLDPKIEF